MILSYHFWIITTILVALKRESEGEPLCPKTDLESGLDHLLDSKYTCFHHRRAPVQHAAGDRGRLMYSLLSLFPGTLIITTLKWTKVLAKNKTRQDEIYLSRFFSPLGIFTWPMKKVITKESWELVMAGKYIQQYFVTWVFQWIKKKNYRFFF